MVVSSSYWLQTVPKIKYCHSVDQKKSKLYLLVFFLVFISNGYFFQSGHHNENARYAQVRSIVDDGRLPIGRYAGRTADTIKFEKQIFPNKAPGTVFMGVLPWSVGKLILSPFEIENEKLLHYLCHLVRWF